MSKTYHIRAVGIKRVFELDVKDKIIALKDGKDPWYDDICSILKLYGASDRKQPRKVDIICERDVLLTWLTCRVNEVTGIKNKIIVIDGNSMKVDRMCELIKAVRKSTSRCVIVTDGIAVCWACGIDVYEFRQAGIDSETGKICYKTYKIPEKTR